MHGVGYLYRTAMIQKHPRQSPELMNLTMRIPKETAQSLEGQPELFADTSPKRDSYLRGSKNQKV